MMSLPVLWTTERLIIRDSGPEEIDDLRDIFNANSHIGPWDPTFTVIASDEIRRLVEQSEARHQPNGENFQMQTIFIQESSERMGYFHIYHGEPKQPRLVFISMLTIRPECQKHGYGREVIEGVVDTCRQMGDRDVIGVRVYLKNWPALRFWTGMGFKEIERIDGDKTLSEPAQASVVLLNRLAA